MLIEQEGSLPTVAEETLACRDLKSGNLLVADTGHILLADFGACAIMEREAAGPGIATALRPCEDSSIHSASSYGGAPGKDPYRTHGISCRQAKASSKKRGSAAASCALAAQACTARAIAYFPNAHPAGAALQGPHDLA